MIFLCKIKCNTKVKKREIASLSNYFIFTGVGLDTVFATEGDFLARAINFCRVSSDASELS